MRSPRPSGSAAEAGVEEMVRRAAGLLLLLGVAWRVLRYAQRFALSDDESCVALNVMDGGWAGVLKPMRGQVAPVLFLWAEKAALKLFGPSEYGLRLLPLLAALLGLVLFWRLARRVLEPLPAGLATGLLSISYFPVRFSSEIKPYSLDLVATVVLLLGLGWLADTTRLRPLALLVPLAPLLVGLSYPSCLVVASVSAVLLPAVLRHPDRRVKVLFVSYNLAAFAVFLGSYLKVGVGQFEGQGGFANEFWQLHRSFPPLQPLDLVIWLFHLVTGLVFAYPLGDVAGAPALTFLLCVGGAVLMRRSARPGVLPICLLPFGWTFLVAVARLYPFGPHPRIAQHLVAPICLLAGTGISAALRLGSPSPAQLLRRARGLSGVLAGIAFVGMAIDLFQPYRSGRDEAFRAFAAGIATEARPEDPVIYTQDPLDEQPAPPPLEFYLRRANLKVFWTGTPDLQAQPPPWQVWVIAYRLAGTPESLKKLLSDATPPFSMVADAPYRLRVGVDRSAPVPCSVSRWKRSPG